MVSLDRNAVTGPFAEDLGHLSLALADYGQLLDDLLTTTA